MKNTWDDPKVPAYRGINLTWLDSEAPNGGLRFEVQVHTADSLAASDAEHVLYEIQRSPNSTAEEAAAAKLQSDLIFGNVPFPDGAKSLTFDHLNKL
ncbi:hypothetical protein [Kutzneria sp. NPDC052558]|uniref:hypothetical protein n=1 Tax=Kutzneria sp. NPDC052558 TaxID=3364121 RepID=UPI0037C6A26F